MESLFEQAVDGIVARGYAVVDGFLSAEEVLLLRSHFSERRSKNAFQPAGIGQGGDLQRNRDIRGDLILWLDRKEALPGETSFLDRMESLMGYLNRTCYLGVRECEFHYAVYPPGTFYKRHLDQFQADDARVMSVITYLNDGWQVDDGGELVLYLDQAEAGQSISIAPLAGRTVLFESARLEHEVLPARRDRMSVTGWLRRGRAVPGIL